MKKTALVTGASGGIGAEIARCLHRDGYQVLLHYNHSEEKICALSAALDNAPSFKADFEKPEDISRMFSDINERFGGVDVLVNNAGLALYGLFTDVAPEDWRRLFTVNVEGTYNCCRHAIPHMVHEKSGRIINTSSIWGICGASCEAAYSSAKAAIIGLTKALAKELGPSGINVNCVAPGVIATEMLSNLSPSDLEALREETPLGRLGTPHDVAELVSFLASDKASFITGQVISPNGGFVI